MSHTSAYRLNICRFVYDNWDDYQAIAEASHDIGSVSDKYAYWTHMATSREYATQCEIQAACALLQCKFTIWLKVRQCIDQENSIFIDRYLRNCFYGDNDFALHINLLLSGNHFQVMLFDVITAHASGREPMSTSHSSSQPFHKHSKRKSPSDDAELDLQRRCKKLRLQYIPPKATDDCHENKLRRQIMEQNIQAAATPKYTDKVEMLIRNRCHATGAAYISPPPGEDIASRKARRQKITSSIVSMKRILQKQPSESDQVTVEQQTGSATPDPVEQQTSSAAPDQFAAPTLNDILRIIKKFEVEQMSYSFSTCTTCKERRIELKLVNGMCKKCRKDKNPIKMYSAENHMDPGKVPAELQDMTVVEQQLICKIAPAIQLHMLKHGGLAARGHCVTFPQEVDEPARIFPKLPKEINIIKKGKWERMTLPKTSEWGATRYRMPFSGSKPTILCTRTSLSAKTDCHYCLRMVRSLVAML